MGFAQAQFSPEFRKAFDNDTQRLLRSRPHASFLAAAAVLAVGLAYVIVLGAIKAPSDPLGFAPVDLSGSGFKRSAGLYTVLIVLSLAVAGAFKVLKLNNAQARGLSLIAAVVAPLLLLGASALLGGWSPALGRLAGLSAALLPLAACALVPWSWRLSMGPAALAAGAAGLFAWSMTDADDPAVNRAVIAGGIGLGVFAFGTLVRVALDRSRMVDVFGKLIHEKYENVKRELMDARRVHESMFPEPVRDGMLRLRYRYEPMEDIGGDFLFIHRGTGATGQRRFSVVVIDVTGHGVAAALAVNRLHGELQRLYANNPEIAPGEVIKALNAYIYVIMSNHGVFATALAARLDADSRTLEYANAGHPPAYLCSHEGIISQLDSTTFMLGVLDDQSFDGGQMNFDFEPGARFIAYTDGALEATNASGEQLGLEGINNLINTGHTSYAAELDGAWTEYLLDRVKSFRGGPALDDTLIVEVSWDKNQLRRMHAQRDVAARAMAAAAVGPAAEPEAAVAVQEPVPEAEQDPERAPDADPDTERAPESDPEPREPDAAEPAGLDSSRAAANP